MTHHGTGPSPAARPRVPAWVGTRLIGPDLCLVNQERREVWLFGRQAPRIWERVQRGGSLAELQADLRAGEGGPEAAALVERFVGLLSARGLVQLDGPAPAPGERSPERAAPATSQREQVFSAAVRADRLAKVWIEVTGQCNFRCRHCYMDFAHAGVLALSDIDRITDELAAHGCPELVLSGGEIFLRRDAHALIACVQAKGFLTSVFSNAFLIDERTVEFLATQRLECVQVSLYGPSAAAHEAVTRHPGSFERATRAVRALTAAGVPVRLACHVQRVNLQEAERLPELAAELGAEYGFDSVLISRRDGRDAPEWLSLWQQAQMYRRGFMTPLRAGTYCAAAVSKGRIAATGDVYPCELVHTVTLGNLLQESLAQIWASPRRREVREQVLSWCNPRCGACKQAAACPTCAALRGFNDPVARGVQACTLTAAALRATSTCAVPASGAAVPGS